jgi:hypothetical protein
MILNDPRSSPAASMCGKTFVFFLMFHVTHLRFLESIDPVQVEVLPVLMPVADLEEGRGMAEVP